MAYSTIEDLTRWIDSAQLLELASSSNEAVLTDDIVQAVLDEVIAAADAEIDSYCLNRWTDLRSKDPVPAEIKKMSTMIAIYFLYLRHGGAPEIRRASYEDCVSKLKLFAKGDIALGLDTSGNKAAAGTDSFQTDASSDYTVPPDDQRVFTEDKLDKF